MLAAVLLITAGVWAQDSISRQMAAVQRQKRAAGPGGSLQRQRVAAARQRDTVARARHEEPWVVVPAPFDGSNAAPYVAPRLSQP